MIVTSAGARSLDLVGQRPGGGGVTLADVGGQDQYAARPGAAARGCDLRWRRRMCLI